MTIALVGYDHKTEDVAVEYTIPAGAIEHAKQVARVRADDPGVALSYSLAPSAAKDIAGTIPALIDTTACDFFLQGFAD
jgi:hypothetical protein